MRGLASTSREAVGVDPVASPFTTGVSPIVDHGFVARWMCGNDAVLHTATRQRPHVTTQTKQAFFDTNITGAADLLEEAAAAQVGAFVLTSTASSFGEAMTPAAGAPVVWVTEALMPIPKNIYGTTKLAAEDLCPLFQRRLGMSRIPCCAPRVSFWSGTMKRQRTIDMGRPMCRSTSC